MTRRKPKRKMPTTIPASQARSEFGELLTQLKKRHRFEITRNGELAGILMSPDDYYDIMEELDPAFQKSLRDAADEYRQGKGRPLAEYLAERKRKSQAS